MDVCVFQGLSSVCCVETWGRKSAPTVLKIPFLARRDSNFSVGRVPLRCVGVWRYFLCLNSHFCGHICSAALITNKQNKAAGQMCFGLKLLVHAGVFLQVHTHPQRRSHQRSPLDVPKGYVGDRSPRVLARDKLELFAVLCIETSHYVSFIKHGPRSQDWIFFDSMADRQGEPWCSALTPQVAASPEFSSCRGEGGLQHPRGARLP